jgi:MFS family permease
MVSDLIEGARYTLANNRIVQTMVIVTITALIPRGALEVLPVVADTMFGRGADGLGQLLSAAGAGALVSGLVIALTGGKHDDGRQLGGSYAWMIVGVLAVCLLPFAGNWLMALVLVGAMGASGTFTAIYTQSIIQLQTADGFRGRVISLWLFTGMGGNALGALCFGALADLFSMPTSLLSLGGVGLAISLASLLWARRFRAQS